MADRIKGIVDAGIPAIGHLGLTPQSVAALGGFKVQGRSTALAKKIVDDAKALEQAGAFMILLEMVPDRVCKLITERAEDCIIMSLGSGRDAHGQLLIYHDMFGLYPKFTPRMAEVFGNAGEVILNGLKAYRDEVIGKQFPSAKHEGGLSEIEQTRVHPSDILDYFRAKDEVIASGDWDNLKLNFMDKVDACNSSARMLTEAGLSFVAAKHLHR